MTIKVEILNEPLHYVLNFMVKYWSLFSLLWVNEPKLHAIKILPLLETFFRVVNIFLFTHRHGNIYQFHGHKLQNY